MTPETKGKSKFVTIESSEPIEDDKGNKLICSHVRIDQLNEDNTIKSSSYHLVSTKIKMNSNGTQNGDPKQLFTPVAMRKDFANLIMSLKLDKK